MEFWFVRFVPKYLNRSTVSNDLLPICMYPFFPAFWSRDMTIYLDFSAFTSKPISLLAISKTSVFFLIVCMLPPNILTSSAKLKVYMYNLISSPICLPEPSWLHILKQRWKAMVIKHLLISNHSVCSWSEWYATIVTTVCFISLLINRYNDWLLPLDQAIPLYSK
jgi:hypothetical protein